MKEGESKERRGGKKDQEGFKEKEGKRKSRVLIAERDRGGAGAEEGPERKKGRKQHKKNGEYNVSIKDTFKRGEKNWGCEKTLSKPTQA